MFSKKLLSLALLATFLACGSAKLPGPSPYTRSNTPHSIRSDCTRMGTVVADDADSCNDFAIQNDLSTFQLINANVGILDPNNCNVSSLVGEVLCLALSNNDCEAVWTVPEGYTCESFANYASISSVTTLEANNPNIVQYCDSTTNIPAGLILCIENYIIPYPGVQTPGVQQTDSGSLSS